MLWFGFKRQGKPADLRRATAWRVVLDAAAVGRIVRRRDDDAVGESALAAQVVAEDRVRDRGCRRVFVAGCGDHFDAIARQHLQRIGERRSR